MTGIEQDLDFLFSVSTEKYGIYSGFVFLSMKQIE